MRVIVCCFIYLLLVCLSNVVCVIVSVCECLWIWIEYTNPNNGPNDALQSLPLFSPFFVLIASLNLNSRSFALIRSIPKLLLFPIRQTHRAAGEEYDIVCCICIPLVNCNRLVFPNGYNGFLYMQNVVRVAYIQNHSYGKELLKHGTYTNNAQNMPILYVCVCVILLAKHSIQDNVIESNNTITTTTDNSIPKNVHSMIFILISGHFICQWHR